ncbi:alpha/beta hydrolase [Arthrobacter sp. AOP36-A1-22]|uniref:alpha/beta hydrolase n=1 Tax=unclassified Arthrobacter TaxID=235627 RepID=UPI0040349ADD
MTTWVPDVLGPGFEQLTLELPSGEVATLVRYGGGIQDWNVPELSGVDVLYIHGWSDYFFQRELAEFWHRAGARFFAIDLRHYGRSLRPGSTPGYITSLDEYDEEIAAALEAMGRDSASTTPLLLMGHSTGGLTATLWAARHPQQVDALVLNSPWLEFQGRDIGRAMMAPLMHAGSWLRPAASLPTIDPGIYTRAVSSQFDGEWDYNLQWRPERGFPLTWAFLNAVFEGQATVADGLDLEIPVLVLLSSRSYLQPRWSVEATTADVALNVDVVAERASSLGSDVTIRRIQDAFHDIFLSPAPVRAPAYGLMGGWAQEALDSTTDELWAARIQGAEEPRVPCRSAWKDFVAGLRELVRDAGTGRR